MAAVLEGCTTKEQPSLLWAKRLSAKDVHKEMFPVYGGKCLSCKAFSLDGKFSLMTKRLKRRCGNVRTSVSILVVDMSEINIFSRSAYHMFYILYPFVTYILTLPRNYNLFYNN
jgi:hypothetical protein